MRILSDFPLVWIFGNDSVKGASEVVATAPIAGVARGCDDALNLRAIR